MIMRRIKSLLGILFLALILLNFKTDPGFLIKGHIEGIEDGTLVTIFDLDEQITLDSAFSTNGDFILDGVVEHPSSCWIRCKDQYAIIQVENIEMTFVSLLKDMQLNCSIQGGKEQELQNELSKLQRPYEISYLGAYDSLVNNKFSNESENERLILKFNEDQSTSQAIYINFGKSHPNSYLGLNIIYMNRKSIPKDSLKIIYQRILPSYKETQIANSLKVFLYEETTQKGKPYIDFTAKTLNGTDFSLSSLKGKYIYLSFWSAGCGPCRMENKFLRQNLNELPKDLSIVSFSIDKNEKSWREASKSDSILWDNVSDLEGGQGRIKTLYEVQAMPTSFLIDRDGIIIEQFIGFDTNLMDRIKTLIED